MALKKGIGLILGSVVLFLIALALPFYFLFSMLEQKPLVTLKSPGTENVTISTPGTYVIWYNYKGYFDGRTYSESPCTLPDGMSFHLTSSITGNEIPLQLDSTLRNETPGHEVISAFTCNISTPGNYILSIQGGDSSHIFSFGPSIMPKILFFFAAISVSILLGIISVALFAWGLVVLLRKPNPLPPTPTV